MKVWKQIPGFEGLYDVSSDGDVFSFKTSKLLKVCIGSAGYPQVDLCRQGKRRTYAIHQLVAAAFIGGRPDGMVVCHNDGDKMNNRPENLRIDSQTENNRDKITHGTIAAGEKNSKAKLTADSVIEIRRLAASGISHRAIAGQFGVSRPAISHIVRGDTWKHIGATQ